MRDVINTLAANGTLVYWVMFFGVMLAGWIVSALFKRRMKEYSEVAIGMSGKEVAEKMLRDHGIYDVKVISTPGQLTDHYNPLNKTVNLSESVYNNYSVAAAAVAAHECGHAVQHAVGYAPLRLRSTLVPIVEFSNRWVVWVLLSGMLLINIFPSLLLFGIILFAATTFFSFVTLPVEVNASQRAIAWLNAAGITGGKTTEMASSALHAAAYTYVVAALSSLATLLYYIMIYLGRRD